MIKKLLLVTFLTLFSQTAIARDYKTVFHAKIISEKATADSECNNRSNEIVPISDDLVTKGWVCVLLPRVFQSGDFAQAIACKNTKNGTMVNTVVSCASYHPSEDKASFTLDDMDEKVKGTNFTLTCVTTVGDRI